VQRTSSIALFTLGVAAVVASGFWVAYGGREPSAATGRPPYVLPVTLGTVERGTLRPRARLTGTVASRNHARMGFELDGRIASLGVELGDRVAQGTVLAKLDERDAVTALHRAEAAAELAQRELDEILAGTREEEKRRLAAELQARKADAELAQKQVTRRRDLAASDVVSKGDMDVWEFALVAAEARVRSAAEALAEAEAGSRPEEIAVARAQLDLRRVEVEIARRAFEKSALVAPFDAAVVDRAAAIGDSVHAGDVVVELVDLARREIEVEVASADAARASAAAEAVVTADELAGFSLVTRLDALVPAADPQSRNFRGVIRLDADEDPEVRLKPGMFVRVDLALAPLENVRLVPADAVRVVASGTIVVRAVASAPEGGAPGLAAEWVPVRVLASDGRASAVEPLDPSKADLADGDRIVLVGVDLAFPGAPLLPREPASAASEAAQ
jgi:HlyD family secretion protein